MNWFTTLLSRAAGKAAQTPNPAAAGTDHARRGLIQRLGLLVGGGLVAGPAAAAAVQQQASFQVNSAEPYIGEIIMFAGNFAPRGWALCNGQLLSIAQNTALFSILGTTYGGNGQTTFALPNLMGRVPLHPGQGPGLTNRILGESSGEENVTLLNNQMPAHNHSLNVATGSGTSGTPAGNVLAVGVGTNNHGEAVPVQGYAAAPDAGASPSAIGVAGGSQPHNNMPPYLGINFIIALEGIFPPRD